MPFPCLPRWFRQKRTVRFLLILVEMAVLTAMNLRCDQYFVEDEQWNEAAENYGKYLKQLKKGKAVLLELGVGFNTPSIIRFPFEKMVREHKNTELIRLNRDEAVIPESFGDGGSESIVTCTTAYVILQ